MDEKDKKGIQEKIEKDSFWIKVLIITIVVVWVSLVGGSWVGHYVADTKILTKHSSLNVDKGGPAEKPKNWKTVVRLDNKGKVIKDGDTGAVESNVTLPDFKNIDEPIPGLDDQAIRTLGNPQEEKNDSSLKVAPPSIDNKAKPEYDNKVNEVKETQSQTTDSDNITQSVTSVNQTSTAPIVPVKIPEKKTQPQTSYTNSVSQPTVKENIEKPKPSEPVAAPAPKISEPARVNSTVSVPAKTENPEPKPAQDQEQNASSFDLQMGSFTNPENAGKMVDDLKQKGYAPRIEKIKNGDKEYFKVKMESINNRDSAIDKAEKLKKDGYDAIIITR